MSIIIDPEFQSLIPPLSKDEYTQLEKNIVKDGIRDALVVWPQKDGNSILIDGHNRWNISAAHAGIRFEVVQKNFKDRDEAIVWIADNQLGKRNLPLPDKVILQDKKRDALARMAKKKLGGDHKSEEFQKSSPKKSWELKPEEKQERRKANRENETDYKIAKAAGTSEDTVRKVRTIKAKSTPETWNQVRSGEKSINQAWLEIKEKERKQADLSAKAHLEAAKERHEDFQNSKTVSMQDIAQDKSDKEEISMQTKRGILNELSHVNRLFLLVNSKELDVSVLSDDDRGKVTYELLDAKGKLLRILSEVAGD